MYHNVFDIWSGVTLPTAEAPSAFLGDCISRTARIFYSLMNIEVSGKAERGFSWDMPQAAVATPPKAVLDQTEEFRLVIGLKGRDHYLPLFEKYEASGPKLGWHWPAFFLTFWWLLYRKMYGRAALYMVLSYVVGTVVTATAGVSPIVGGVASVVYLILLFAIPALISNRGYYSHCKKLIGKARKTSDNVQTQHSMLVAKGGASSVVLFIVLAFFLIAGIGVLAAIALPAYQDYTMRAKTAESLTYGRQVANEVGSYYQQNSRLPRSVEDVSSGFTKPRSLQKIELDPRNGVLTLHVSVAAGGDSLQLVPSKGADGTIDWACRNVDMQKSYLPVQCRQ